MPHTGTRFDFMNEFVSKFALWMPNIQRARLDRQIAKLQKERMLNLPQMVKDKFRKRKRAERRAIALNVLKEDKAAAAQGGSVLALGIEGSRARH